MRKKILFSCLCACASLFVAKTNGQTWNNTEGAPVTTKTGINTAHPSFANGQPESYYYYFDKKVPVVSINNKLLVYFEKNTPNERINFILDEVNQGAEKPELYDNCAILTIQPAETENIRQRLNEHPEVRYANSMLNIDNAFGVTGEILVFLKNPSEKDAAVETIKQFGCLKIKENNIIKGQLVIECPKNADVFEKANRLFETGLFTYSVPDFAVFNLLNTNDTYFNDQWSLRNTGQVAGQGINCDSRVIQAHNITMGNPNIKVAVIDVGVDLTHPDLVDNLLPGYDAVNNTNNGAPQNYNPAIAYHGTSCAGLIAAKANNGIGITGVAPNCKIIPVGCMITATTLNTVATGIRWAADIAKADVINNSWTSEPLGGTSPAVEQEISWATSNGRGGLGCVVVFATGNQDNQNYVNSVNWPATLSNVIAVGATTHTDDRAAYSRYGQEIDIAAPGGDHNIYTTTIQGQGNLGPNYKSDFSGTSAAAPILSGVAALILSVNACLRWDEVKRILELTTDKPHFADYCASSGHPNGTWNEKLGYGRVNALRAVKLALDYQHVYETNGSSNNLITTFSTWTLLGGCYLPPANYMTVEQHEIKATITVPSPSAGGGYYVNSSGVFGSNPNSGANFAVVSGISGNQVTVSTYAYFIKYNAIGQTINTWFPAQPNGIKFWMYDYNTGSIYFQNKTENNLNNSYRNADPIYAGYNVTNNISYGNYVLKANNRVELISKRAVELRPGFFCTSSSNMFLAQIGKFNNCVQYPGGLKTSNPVDSSSIAPFTDLAQGELQQQIETMGFKVDVFPNPAADVVNIVFDKKIAAADILILSIDGKKQANFKYKKNESCSSKVDMKAIAPGIYNVIINTPSNGSYVTKITKL